MTHTASSIRALLADTTQASRPPSAGWPRATTLPCAAWLASTPASWLTRRLSKATHARQQHRLRPQLQQGRLPALGAMARPVASQDGTMRHASVSGCFPRSPPGSSRRQDRFQRDQHLDPARTTSARPSQASRCLAVCHRLAAPPRRSSWLTSPTATSASPSRRSRASASVASKPRRDPEQPPAPVPSSHEGRGSRGRFFAFSDFSLACDYMLVGRVQGSADLRQRGITVVRITAQDHRPGSPPRITAQDHRPGSPPVSLRAGLRITRASPARITTNPIRFQISARV